MPKTFGSCRIPCVNARAILYPVVTLKFFSASANFRQYWEVWCARGVLAGYSRGQGNIDSFDVLLCVAYVPQQGRRDCGTTLSRSKCSKCAWAIVQEPARTAVPSIAMRSSSVAEANGDSLSTAHF